MNSIKKKSARLGLAITIACSLQSCLFDIDDFDYEQVEYPFILFVNQSTDSVWVEMMSPEDMTYQMNAPLNDTLYYGWGEPVPPQSIRQLTPWGYYRWDYAVKNNQGFVCRLFVMDAAAPIDFRESFSKKQEYDNSNYDSLTVRQMLSEFEQAHLLRRHWYTKEELDSLNWTIVYPQK